MMAKIIGVLVVFVVLVGGIYFYRDVASPAITPDSVENQNYQESASATTDTKEPLPVAGNTAQAEASIIVSDIISAAAADAASYTVDEENFLLDDAGDLDAFGQAITIQ
jgi:flagellar basal body-associated protein FliL